MKLKLLKMHFYRLKRTDSLDKLVWWGTTVLGKTTKDKPIAVNIGDKTTYFYNQGIEKVNTTCLKSRWKEPITRKVTTLSFEQQKELISKFTTMTEQLDPYEMITFLSLENQILKDEIKRFTIEKEQQYEME
ncbi:hypothetical protein [Spiroplasma endosymbiont of Dromius quadrimaculatus]|uniref:hypothetical protein n=1 Tax=Spiroplasma endosymbiont of Dromius quadrimaculatus TaxID=3066283 RepID=UPI00313AFBE9